MTAAGPTDEHYDLKVQEGSRRRRRFASAGIALHDSGLTWTVEGNARLQSYRDIRRIHLQWLEDDNVAESLCRIEFADQTVLHVSAMYGRGTAEETRARPSYRLFVQNLHRHLKDLGNRGIVFQAGNLRWHWLVLLLCVVQVVAPLVGYIYGGATVALVLGGICAAMVLPVLLIKPDRVVTYAPDRIPPNKM